MFSYYNITIQQFNNTKLCMTILYQATINKISNKSCMTILYQTTINRISNVTMHEEE